MSNVKEARPQSSSNYNSYVDHRLVKLVEQQVKSINSSKNDEKPSGERNESR
jgi:hypothetical protein